MKPTPFKFWAAVAGGIGCFGMHPANAGDWPQWRGPMRDGISTETGLLQEWPKEGPRLVWQVKDLGEGYSTPSIVGERFYLLSNEGLENELVQARSVADGQRIWSTRLGKVGNPQQKPNYPAARSTPTVEGDVLYALGSDGDLACLEIAGGKVRWQKNLRQDFGGEPGIWAYAESPLIDGDLLICTPGGKVATMVALNKHTGEAVWKCAMPEADQAAYASAIVAELAGRKQYIQFLQKGLVGLDPRNGKVLWRFAQTADLKSGGNIQTPVAYQDCVYSAAGLVGGGLARIKASHGVFETESVYFSKKLPIGLGGVVRVGEHLYGTAGPTLQCVEFSTGKLAWEDRSIGAGAICFAEGRLYLHGENDEVALVEASPAAYREAGRFELPEQPDRGRSKAWPYPVIAHGRLYLRDLGTLWCYDLREPQGTP